MDTSGHKSPSTDRHHRRGWTLVACLFALSVVFGCTREAPAGNPGAPLPSSATLPFRGCSTDDECMYVQNGCCSCANGGEELAINRKHENAFKRQLKCDPNFPCTLMARIPPCGSGTVSCSEGLCTYQLPTP